MLAVYPSFRKSQVAFSVDKYLKMKYNAFIMKFMQRLMVNISDQVLSTALLFAIGFLVYRGAISLWNIPPKPVIYLVIIGIGTAFGILKSLKRPPSYD